MQNAEFRSGMRHGVWACSVVCVLCLTAARANDIRIFFGRPEYYTGLTTTSFVPDAHLGESAPPGTYTLGIWAEIQYDDTSEQMDVWDSVLADYAGVGAGGELCFVMDNFDHRIGAGTAYRWEAWPEDIDCIYFVSGTRFGLGGLYPREFGYGNGYTDWWSYTVGTPGDPGARYFYWLGNVSLSATGPGQVWFDAWGVTRAGGDPANDHVYFGETDPVPWDPASDPMSYMPDFVFTPEPASVALLALAGWVVRRR